MWGPSCDLLSLGNKQEKDLPFLSFFFFSFPPPNCGPGPEFLLEISVPLVGIR